MGLCQDNCGINFESMVLILNVNCPLFALTAFVFPLVILTGRTQALQN